MSKGKEASTIFEEDIDWILSDQQETINKVLLKKRIVQFAEQVRASLVEELIGYGERGGDSVYKQTIGAEVVRRHLEQKNTRKGI